jgi:effector-binding domain-containing protein
MKKLFSIFFIILFLFFNNAYTHELPKPGILSFMNIPAQKILYVVHKGNEPVATSFAKLVAYYMKDSTPFTVIFPQMTIQVSSNEKWVAIAYTGNASETNDVKLKEMPACLVASKVYKGSYDKIGNFIKETYREILTTKQYVPKDDMPLRLLYWNSPDDNQPKDLITEVQIPVVKVSK